MPDEKKYFVKEYMSTRHVTISKSATLREAVELMIREKTNGLVITNGNREVVGILSSWDIIKQVVPDYLEDEEHLASFEAESVFVKRTQEVADDPVERFMTKNVHKVKATDTLMEAAALLAEHGIRQLPVVDENEKLVGYINRTDIKRAVGDVLGIQTS